MRQKVAVSLDANPVELLRKTVKYDALTEMIMKLEKQNKDLIFTADNREVILLKEKKKLETTKKCSKIIRNKLIFEKT